jgi:hypothetical protein
VKGKVVEVFLGKGGNAYLNFGAGYPTQTFSAEVLAKGRICWRSHVARMRVPFSFARGMGSDEEKAKRWRP